MSISSKKNIALIVTAILVVSLGVVTSLVTLKPDSIKLQALTWFGDQARTLPEFQLKDHNNQVFDEKSLLGKWHLLFFGFTHCPDICPTTLQLLTQSLKAIDHSDSSQEIQFVFISIDPERDKLDIMKSYVTYFDKNILSATAHIEKINVLTQSLGIMHDIEKSADSKTYNVVHSGSLVLIDPQGRYAGIFSPPHDSNIIASDLIQLLR